MFLKKSGKPGVVRLPNGKSMSIADLPAPNADRWVARMKARVVLAVRSGLLTLAEAQERYNLSEEEYTSWEHGLANRGLEGLKVTKLTHRQP